MSEKNWMQQIDELEALFSIWDSQVRVVGVNNVPQEVLEQKRDEMVATLRDLGAPSKSWGITVAVMVDVQVPEDGCRIDLMKKGGLMAGKVKYLPPIKLEAHMTDEYPNMGMPVVDVSAPWLSRESKRHILQTLHDTWSLMGLGTPVIFSWVENIGSFILENEGGEDAIVLSSDSANEMDEEEQMNLLSTKAEMLLQYNITRERSVFEQGIHVCLICYDELPGTKFTMLDCGHSFCTHCLERQAQVHTSEGALDAIKCPDTNCQRPLDPHEIKRLLSPGHFERWEDLTLKRALDSMSDASYCPRCGTLSLEDPAENCADCPKCFFVFCTFCEEARHPGVHCVGAATRLEILREKAKGGNREAIQELRKKEHEHLSLLEIEKLSKPCPVCGMAIERSQGCNKMTCTCGAFFCYKCGKQIQGYDHFKEGSECILFDAAEILRWERRWEEQVGFQQAAMLRHQFMGDHEIGPVNEAAEGGEPQGRRNNRFTETLCPTCGQINYKIARNNHIHCWSCARYFCARCRVMLQRKGGTHFGPNGCPQHS